MLRAQAAHRIRRAAAEGGRSNGNVRRGCAACAALLVFCSFACQALALPSSAYSGSYGGINVTFLSTDMEPVGIGTASFTCTNLYSVNVSNYTRAISGAFEMRIPGYKYDGLNYARPSILLRIHNFSGATFVYNIDQNDPYWSFGSNSDYTTYSGYFNCTASSPGQLYNLQLSDSGLAHLADFLVNGLMSNVVLDIVVVIPASLDSIQSGIVDLSEGINTRLDTIDSSINQAKSDVIEFFEEQEQREEEKAGDLQDMVPDLGDLKDQAAISGVGDGNLSDLSDLVELPDMSLSDGLISMLDLPSEAVGIMVLPFVFLMFLCVTIFLVKHWGDFFG